MPVEQPEPPANLRQRLMQFTLSEVEAFCHDLGINSQLLRHQKLDEFVLDLLGHCQRRPGLIERLTQLVEQAEAERAIPPAEGECPYKGLQAYEEADAHLFFGREKLTQELVEHLRKHNFLAVVGASGSGKSSVVKAGVIPQLRKDNQWLIVPPFRPGLNPFEQLALHLLPLIDPTMTPTGRLIEQTKLSQAFVEGTLPLSKVVYQILQNNPGRGRLLLVVDQFEELFTHQKDKQSQEQWLNFLTEPLSQPLNRLTLLITLRGDFYNSAIQYLPLKPWLETSQKIVTALTPAELEEAITRPAAHAWQFQNGLVATILEDVAQEPGGLPFLSQALLKTWEKRQGRQLTLAGYLASGGVKEAISQTAEQVYNQFTPPAQEVVRGVLLRLTQLGEGREDTRRRLNRPELAGLPYPPELVQEVLDKLTAPQVRLLTQDQTFVEVAHEALIRGWPLLRQWLDEDREGLRLHRQLTEAAGEWERLGRDKSMLWRGARLVNALETDFDKWGISELEDKFLDVSIYEEERQAHRTQLTILVLSVLVVVAFLTAGGAVNFYYEADSARATSQAEAVRADENWVKAVYNQQQAEIEADISLSMALASISKTIFDDSYFEDDLMKSFLLSVEALQIAHTNIALTTLNERWPYMAKPLFMLTTDDRIDFIEWNATGTRILIAMENGIVKVWNQQSGEFLFALRHNSSVDLAKWNKTETRILTSNGSMVQVWDGQSGEFLFVLKHNLPVDLAEWNETGTHILTSDGSIVQVWDGQSGELLYTLQHEGGIYLAQWNQEGSYILTIDEDGIVYVWDGQSGELLYTLQHEGGIYLAQWNKNGSRILTNSPNGSAKVWDGQSGELLYTFQNEGGVYSPKWNKDGSRILAHTGDTGDTIQVWDGQSGQILFTVQHISSIDLAEWNEDGTRILTRTITGSVFVLDGRTGDILFQLGGNLPLQIAQWNKIGNRIVTENKLGKIQVWDGQSGDPLFILPNMDFETDVGVSIRWNKPGTHILTNTDDTVQVWDGQSNQFPFVLTGIPSINSVQWDKVNKRILATGVYSNNANVWDGRNGELLFTLYNVDSAFWNKNGTCLLTIDMVKDVSKVWDGQSGLFLFTLTDKDLVSAQCNEQGTHIVTITQHGLVKTWDIQNRINLKTIALDETDSLDSILWNKDETKILTTSGDIYSDKGTAKVWDIQSGRLLLTLLHEGNVNSAQWIKNETRILTASDDGTAKVWDAESGKHLFTIKEDIRLASAKLNSSETYILTTSYFLVEYGMEVKSVAKLWDAQTGELLLTMEGDSSGIASAEWSEDESQIWIVTENGLVRSYYTDPEELIAEACSRATRNLTWLEWQTYLPGRPYHQTCPNLPVHPSVPESERP